MSSPVYEKGTVSAFQIGMLQMKSNRVLKDQLSLVLKSFGLTITEWIILCLLFQKKQMRLADIATLLEVESPHVTNVVELMVNKELVQRRADSSDKRAKIVTLTLSGEQILPGIEYAIVEKMKSVFNGVSEDEIAAYMKVKKQIILNTEHC